MARQMKVRASRSHSNSNNTKVLQLRREIVEVEINIESMRVDYRRIGERTDWSDPSLDARYDDICLYEDRVVKLRRQLRRLEQLATGPRPPQTAV